MVNMVPLTQLIHQQMDFMLSCSHQNHIHYKLTQKLAETLSLLGNWLSKHNIFVLQKKALISFGISIPNMKLSRYQHAQSFIHDLMAALGTTVEHATRRRRNIKTQRHGPIRWAAAPTTNRNDNQQQCGKL